MEMPKPTEEARQAFSRLVPDHPGVVAKPMFGQPAAFVNGNMFCGLFGDGLVLRLGEPHRATLLAAGGSDFEPMPGRKMTGYVLMPPAWRGKAKQAEGWVAAALEATAKLPAKQPKAKPAAKKATARK